MPDQNLTSAELDELANLRAHVAPDQWEERQIEKDEPRLPPELPIISSIGILAEGVAEYLLRLHNAAPALIATARRALEQDERIRELEQRLAAALARPAGKGRTLERAPLIIGDDDGEETPNAG